MNAPGRVAGKVALITGAAIGQGRCHAIRLAEEGADIVAIDICRPVHPDLNYRQATPTDLEDTRRLVEKTGRQCITVRADVRSLPELRTAVDDGIAAFGRIDIVCANAGAITFHARSWEIPPHLVDLVIDVNLKGTWNTIAATVPAMIEAKRGGSIILTSSVGGLRGHALYAHYNASKHGIVGLARSFATELARHRIRVNTVNPGAVSSPGMGSCPDIVELLGNDPVAMAGVTNLLPDLDTDPDTPFSPVAMLSENEISNAVLFLASDESRYVTGTTLSVDAGNANKP